MYCLLHHNNIDTNTLSLSLSLSISLSLQDQQKQVKKSYQHLLRIFDILEETLLRGRKEKRLHQTVQRGESSNITQANQQQADNDNF
jgi:AraC-like DNA-binding protein